MTSEQALKDQITQLEAEREALVERLTAGTVSARKLAILDCIQVLELYRLRFDRESGQTISSILGVLSSAEGMLLNLLRENKAGGQ